MNGTDDDGLRNVVELGDYLSQSKRANGAEVLKKRAVFDRAYDTEDRFEDQAKALGLAFWGSDCNACEGHATFGSMCCESCGSTLHTVPLWVGPGRAPRPRP